MFTDFDFTLNKFEKLCCVIAASKYATISIADYLQLDFTKKNKPFIILRHDIDRSPSRALEIAAVEHKHGIPATFYFRYLRGIYIREIINKIASFGHEIGYHYETIDKCKGNIESSIKLFEQELTDFRRTCELKTVCGHGNPLTKWDNKDIWKSLKLSDFELSGEAFFALDFNKFAYFSDSGRTWVKNKSQKMPGKDDVTTAFDNMQARNTDDLIKIIEEGTLPNICILTHPERWTSNGPDFVKRYLTDLVFSWGKVGIQLYREIS
jgi:hypothetical protein